MNIVMLNFRPLTSLGPLETWQQIQINEGRKEREVQDQKVAQGRAVRSTNNILVQAVYKCQV